MADEDGDMPSVPRKKREVELSRGVVILPPERMGREEQREKKETYIPPTVISPPTKKTDVRQISTPSAPTVSNLLAVVAILLALVGLALGYVSLTNYNNLKNELKGMAADLREYREANISLVSNLGATHSVDTALPVKEVIPSFSLPVQPQEVQGSGTINVILPGYTFPVSIPWNGTITIFGTLNVNTSELPENKELRLAYTLPGQGDITLKITGNDLWTQQLEDIATRLERLSG